METLCEYYAKNHLSLEYATAFSDVKYWHNLLRSDDTSNQEQSKNQNETMLTCQENDIKPSCDTNLINSEHDGVLSSIDLCVHLLSSLGSTESPQHEAKKLRPPKKIQPTPEIDPKKKHSCGVCGKHFTCKSNLRTHSRVHTGDKPFICPFCAKAFSESGNLGKHLRFHIGGRPYPCEYCEKAFQQRSDLKKHTRVHTGERPYKCPHCKYGFSQKQHLKVHLRTTHDEEGV